MHVRKAFWCSALTAAISAAASPALAQIQTDGSMGNLVSLSGNMVITSELGRQSGANLFHSFSLFNIRTGESATFTSSVSGIKNVIGRVTGNELSTIDGLLSCKISGADLYLINPNGIAFGKNASVDVKGSFYASTADYLGFKDGKQFKARPDAASDVTLSVASPAAFGFLDSTPAPITVNESVLKSVYGEALSLVGGDITLTGAKLSSDMGRIDLVSVASAGEALLNSAGAMDVKSFGSLGKVSIGGGSQLDVSEDYGLGGSVYIRGGRFFMDSSKISSSAIMGPPGPIDITISGDISVTGASEIYSESLIEGRGADIRLNAGGNIDISGASKLLSTTMAFEGRGGDIRISAAGGLTVTEESTITAETTFFGGAKGGDIAIDLGGDLTVTKGSTIRADANLATGMMDAGDSGDITISGRNVLLSAGGRIFTSSFMSAPGKAGNVSIKATDTISIAAAPGDSLTGISSNPDEIDWNIEDPTAGGIGGAGNIKLEAKTLSLNGGFVSTRNDSDAATGNISLNVSTLKLDGGAYISASTTGGVGEGGKLTIQASEAVSLAGNSRIESGSKSSGSGGSIVISARDLTADNSFIDSSASSFGHAGDIKITVESLRLTGSAVQTSAKSSAGGNIMISVGDMFMLQNSAVSASANSVTPQHNGGNVTIGTPQFFILNSSDILARANAGNGGNIKLSADYFLRSADSVINASSERGIDGQVLIESPNDVTGTVTVLEMPALDLSALLRERCAAAVLRERSSFTVEGRGGLPSSPGGFLASPLVSGKTAGQKKAPAGSRQEQKD